MVWIILCLLILLYLAASPRLGEPFYRKELFEPFKYPIGDYQDTLLEGVQAQDVFFPTANGDKLHAWYFAAPEATKTALVNHGNTGNIADLQILLRLLLRSGCSVFVYDYRGYGRSEGKPTIRGVCEDAVAAYDHLVNKIGITPENIIIYGESLGGSISAEVVRSRPCAGIILQSAFSSLQEAATDEIPLLVIYPSWLFPVPDLNILSVQKKAHPPILIMHGEHDKDLALRHAHALFEQASQPKQLVLLPNTLHADIAEADFDFFVSTVRGFQSGI